MSSLCGVDLFRDGDLRTETGFGCGTALPQGPFPQVPGLACERDREKGLPVSGGYPPRSGARAPARSDLIRSEPMAKPGGSAVPPSGDNAEVRRR